MVAPCFDSMSASSSASWRVIGGIGDGSRAEPPPVKVKQYHISQSGPEVVKLFSCSTQLSMKFILLINVKMLTSVVILTFISMISTISECF